MHRYPTRARTLDAANAPASGFRSVQALAQKLTSGWMVAVWLMAILLVGGWLRFTGLDWDEQQHLHPDERFLTMVTNDMVWPEQFDQYFDPTTSPLSPYAHNPDVWYVYGTVPVYLTKWVGKVLDQQGFNEIYLVGRALSGVFDLGCILFLFLIGRRLYDDRVALLGAGLYALAAHPIQLSHFYAVDTFANFFVVMTIYWAIRASEKGNWWFYVLMGLSLGAGLASKLSVITLGFVVVLAGCLDFYRCYQRRHDVHMALEHLALRWGTVLLLLLLTFRLLQPIAFEGPGFFNLGLFDKWVSDVDQMKSRVEGNLDTPPFVQWADRPDLWFPWKNMVLWGMGLPLGLAAWAGWVLAGYELLRSRKVAHLIPVGYVGATFLYHGTQWVKYMRYFMPIYPLLALLAGYLIMWVWRRAAAAHPVRSGAEVRWSEREQARHRPRLRGVLWSVAAPLLMVVVVGGTLFYALAFTAIYRNTASRVEASRWIYEHIPRGSVLVNEHWDDSLPLRVDGKDGFFDWYTGLTMQSYDHSKPEKIDHIINNLVMGDYIILSSNRLYGSITRLPRRYPVSTRYYDLLFAEQLGFEQVAEFTSYPRFAGITIPDQSADESFTVYDHPKVTIFQKTEQMDPQRLRDVLTEGIDWYTYVHLTPKRATAAPSGLMFLEDDRARYRDAGTWAAMFDHESLSNRVPVLVWLLAVEGIGLLALPLCFVAFAALRDRGLLLAKLLGLLIVGWVAWVLASWRVLPFGSPVLVLALALLALVSAVLFWRQRREMGAFVRERWRLLVAEEALFLLLFLAGVWFRWRNPDLWTPLGDNYQPMNLAHLNAVVKTPFFPPYDPWYAGGVLNVAYFGYVLVAVLVKLTGIVPEIAYNLAVPTFFALTGVGAFVVAFNLVEGWRERDARHEATGQNGSGGAFVAGVLAVFSLTTLGQPVLDWFLASSDPTDTPLTPSPVPLSPMGENVRMIAEIPAFDFIQANLNPALMSLPVVLLALALVVALVRSSRALLPPNLSGRGGLWWRRFAHVVRGEGLLLFLLAFVTGSLYPLNTWDRSLVLLLVAGGLFFIHYQRQRYRPLVSQSHSEVDEHERPYRSPLYAACPTSSPQEAAEGERPPRRVPDLVSVGWATVWRFGLVVLLGYLLFWPFHASYASPYDGLEVWRGERTPISAYITMYGLFLFVLVSYLIAELAYPHRHNALVRLVRLVVQSRRRFGRFRALHERLVGPSLWYHLALYAVFFVGAFVLMLGVFQQGVVALAVLLLLLAVLLLFRADATPRQQALLLLVALGSVLSLLAELASFKGYEEYIEEVLRQQAVHTFSRQVWVVWGIAAAACLPVLALRLTPGPVAGVSEPSEVPQPRRSRARASALLPRPGDGLILLWWPVLVILLMASFISPVRAALSQLDNHFAAGASEREPTLDGLAFMQEAAYHQHGRDFALDWDRQAIQWMRERVPESPVMVEASQPDTTWAARVSALTGLPGVVGWEWQQKYQRGVMPPYLVDVRKMDVQAIYGDPDPDVALSLLTYHQVEYVYVGPLEQAYYGGPGLEKFDQYEGDYWVLVYENPEVKIYRVTKQSERPLRNPPA